jgi:acetyl-CoA C-acetyltransferase
LQPFVARKQVFVGRLNGDVFVVAAVRSPIGRRGGALASWHPVDLAAEVLGRAVDAAGVDPAAVDDVYLGCVNAIGAQAGNIARVAWLAAGLPWSVPGATVDRRCGSSLQAVELAAMAIASGALDVVVAGGVESMSRVPIGSPVALGQEHGLGGPYDAPRWHAVFGDQEMSQFRGAELAAERAGIDRAAMEAFALESHRRAVAARDAGAFTQLVPVGGLEHDEGPRADTDLATMAGLRTVLPGGSITAATSSQISDGAAALVLAGADAVRRHGLTPLARVVAVANVGADPVLMVTGPVPATEKVLGAAGLTIDDIDRFEVNEAFASVVLHWQAELGVDISKVNVNGGAVALGHPLGASGARILCDLIGEVRRSGARHGLQTMCEGAGTASATIIECG